MTQKPDRLDSKRIKLCIKNSPCIVCGANPPSDPDHVRTRGAGGNDFIKTSDGRVILNMAPLCRQHHTERHALGLDTFKTRYGAYKAYLKRLGHPLAD